MRSAGPTRRPSRAIPARPRVRSHCRVRTRGTESLSRCSNEADARGCKATMRPSPSSTPLCARIASLVTDRSSCFSPTGEGQSVSIYALLCAEYGGWSITQQAMHGCGTAGRERAPHRARPHCRFAPSPIHFISNSLTYSLPLFSSDNATEPQLLTDEHAHCVGCHR